MSKRPEYPLSTPYAHRGWVLLSRAPNAERDRSAWSDSLGVADLRETTSPGLVDLGWGGISGASSTPGPEAERCGPATVPHASLTTAGARRKVGVDELGFSHVYTRQLPGEAGLSTSARALGLLGNGQLCLTSVAAQALLGWQLGTQTMFAGVHKIDVGGSATISNGQLSSEPGRPAPWTAAHADPVAAAREAAHLLRGLVSRHLDEFPDAELQLTGGLDSRILLAAVPPSRRRALGAMTLTVPDSEDTAIATELSARSGMPHRYASFSGLADLTPEQAFELCVTAARRVDSAADPLAVAAVDFAESSLETRPRIGGLGGEFARGFYYLGPVNDVPVTLRRVSRLARWRMFTNEAAPVAMFRPHFTAMAEASVIRAVHAEFTATRLDWFRAMDEFYLGQRMHRWAGVLGSATALERPIIHPMLDPRFLAIARSVPPAAKKNARFLSQILVELDPDLARLPMDGRPPPIEYAQPTLRSRAKVATATAGKVQRKVAQRLTRAHRSPEGGVVLAGLVVQHLRDHPEVLTDLTAFEIFDPSWLDRVVSYDEGVETSAVSMLVNLLATRPAG